MTDARSSLSSSAASRARMPPRCPCSPSAPCQAGPIVHGGGNEVGDWSRRLGNEPATLDGLRVTDAETLDVAVAVLRGLVNARLVASFAPARNVPAIGLGGADGDLLGAERFDARLGEVGRVVRVNTDLLETLAGAGNVRDRGADRPRRRRGAAQRDVRTRPPARSPRRAVGGCCC